MSKALISIIIPVYNLEKYIKECLDSILLQTYQNYEIIIVDDGSTDSSLRICQGYSSKDNRIKIYHQNNKGAGSAKNTGLKYVNGEYVTFIDGDDLVEKNYLEVLISNIDKNTISAIYFYFYKEDKLNKKLKRKEKVIPHEKILKEYFTDSTFMSPWGKLIPKEYVYDLKFKDGILEDADAMYKVLLKADRIIVSNQSKYLYRVRDESTMNKSGEEKYLAMSKRTFEIENQLNEMKVSRSVYKTFYSWQLEYLLVYYLRTTLSDDTKEELSRIRKLLQTRFFKYFSSKTNFKTRVKLIINLFSPSILRSISFNRQRHIKEKRNDIFK